MGVFGVLATKFGIRKIAGKIAGRAILTGSMLSNLFLPKLLRAPKEEPIEVIKVMDPWWVALGQDVEFWVILGLIVLALTVTSPAFDNSGEKKHDAARSTSI